MSAARSHTKSVTIASRPEDVFAYVADLEKLPEWAIGFAKAVRRDSGGWVVTTGRGDEVKIRAEVDPDHGVVDFLMSPTPDVEFPAATRVVANGEGSEYVFTLFQAPGMPDEVFEKQNAELGRELVVLKAKLETACPL